MLEYQAIDADMHYYEPDDCCTRYIEPAFRDRAIHVVPTDRPGVGRWMMGDQAFEYIPMNTADEGSRPGAYEDMHSGKATMAFTDLFRPKDVPAMMQRSARLELMDEMGIGACMMSPTSGLLFEHEGQRDIPALCANWRAFNRWLEEEWGFGDDGRIFAIPNLTMLDVDFAVEETERVAALGSKFIVLRPGPVSGRSPADPIFDRFWRTVEETGVKVVYHVAATDYNEQVSAYWSEDPNRTAFENSSLQIFHSLLDRPVRDTIAALTLHNLFGRFPKVQILSIELGSAWLRPLLKSLDKAAMFGAAGKQLGGRLLDLPSETLPRHLTVSPYYEEDIRDLVDLIGLDRVLYGSDFPHPEGLRVPLSYVKNLEGFSDYEIRRIMRDNAAELLGIAELASV